MADAKLNAELERAFADLLSRYKLNSDSEPYMLFAALALEQDRLAVKEMELDGRIAALEKAIKPKLIIPAVAPNNLRSN